MKKLLCTVLAIVTTVSLIGCGTAPKKDSGTSEESKTTNEVVDVDVEVDPNAPVNPDTVQIKINGHNIKVGETKLSELLDDFGTLTSYDADPYSTMITSYEKLDLYHKTDMNDEVDTWRNGKVTVHLTSPKHNEPTVLMDTIIVGIEVRLDYPYEGTSETSIQLSVNGNLIKPWLLADGNEILTVINGDKVTSTTNPYLVYNSHTSNWSDATYLYDSVAVSCIDTYYSEYLNGYELNYYDKHTLEFEDYSTELPTVNDRHSVRISNKVYTFPFKLETLLANDNVFILKDYTMKEGTRYTVSVRTFNADGTNSTFKAHVARFKGSNNYYVVGLQTCDDKTYSLTFYKDIMHGQSTYTDVIAAYGTPTEEKITYDDNIELTYIYSDSNEDYDVITIECNGSTKEVEEINIEKIVNPEK